MRSYGTILAHSNRAGFIDVSRIFHIEVSDYVIQTISESFDVSENLYRFSIIINDTIVLSCLIVVQINYFK